MRSDLRFEVLGIIRMHTTYNDGLGTFEDFIGAASRVGRVRGAIDAYAQQIGSLRLVANGVDLSLLRPLVIDELDVSTPASRSALMLGVLTYFLLFATLTGGLHLAIDTTAGERERKSLEPLLTLPVKSFGGGWAFFRETIADPRVIASYRLTLGASFAAATLIVTNLVDHLKSIQVQ